MPDELIVLGSSSGVPTQYRHAPAYALKVTSKLFLIECGAPVGTLLYQYGLDPIEVRAVFLSHWHMGHIANLGLLLTQNHHRQRPRPLNIYGPAGTRGKIYRLLADSFILPDDLNYTLKVTNVKRDETYEEALLRVTYFKTQHLEKPELKMHFGRKALSCGMIINGPGWRIVYSGDLGSPTELPSYLQGCDLLIYNMGHHRPESVAELAATADIPHILITHLGSEFNESPEKIMAAFAGLYQGDLIVARDGTRLRLSQIRKDGTIEITTTNKVP